jgi:hypothetical protein
VCCRSITDAGAGFIIQAPCLSSPTLGKCKNVTNVGMVALVRSQKLESLTVIGCRQISLEGVRGAETDAPDIFLPMSSKLPMLNVKILSFCS